MGIRVVQIGSGPRMERVLRQALDGMPAGRIPAEPFPDLRDSRVLFAVCLDDYGPDPELAAFLRRIRQNPGCLSGSVAGIVVDGNSELYTKEAARDLALAASMAGCTFPGKALVEGTGSLFNQHIQAKQRGISLEETYIQRVRELAAAVLSFGAPKPENPKLLVLHASDSKRSNTYWMGTEIIRRLSGRISTELHSLQNGTIMDCRGCSYRTCLHYAQNNTCYYGGAISEEIIPAVSACSAMLFLCPNYNDSVSANLMAFFNRLTNLLVREDLSEKYLFGIIVSGYSGGDIVAKQLLGTMSFNKTSILPPRFCILQTAHEPGSAARIPDIGEKLDGFAEHIQSILLG